MYNFITVIYANATVAIFHARLSVQWDGFHCLVRAHYAGIII